MANLDFGVWSDDPHVDNLLLFVGYVLYVFFGLVFLRQLSIVGRPVAHGDRKLGLKHKEAEAERVEILERLKSGSKLADGGLLQRGVDLVLPAPDQLSDVEREPLCSPLLQNSDTETTAKAATVSLSAIGGFRLPLEAYEWMKKVSKQAASGEGATDDSFVSSSEKALLQSEVELHDGLLDRLKDLFKLKCFSVDKDVVQSLKDAKPPFRVLTPLVQVDNWAVLKPSVEGVDLLRLPVDKVPVVLHAEYAAGLLTITGVNLEDADIYISGEDALYTVKMKVWRFLKSPKIESWISSSPWRTFSETAEDVATIPFRLAWTDMKTVFVYATKKVQLGGNGETVDAISKAVDVVDSFWRTVVGLWIPTISLWIFTLYNFRKLLLSPYFPLRWISSINGFLLVLWILVLCRYSAKRFMEPLKFHVETLAGGIGQGILVFYYGFRSLKGPKIEFPKSERRKILLPPASPSMIPRPLPKKDDDRKPSADERDRVKKSSADESPARVKKPGVDESAGVKKPVEDEPASGKPVDDPDWEWPAYDEFEDKKGVKKLVKHSEEAKDEVSPFRVVYRRKAITLWPDAVRVDLFSAPLISIVQKVLPQNGDLRCLETPPIKVRDLFVVLDSLKTHVQVPASDADASYEGSDGHVGSTEAPKVVDKGQVHLQHLLRFMEKECSDVAVRLRRMTEEKHVAWDMIWTFLTPGRKVVYTCDHSQEILAAVVSKISYTKLPRDWVLCIDLTVWDYDGRSYRKCQIRRTIDKFEGERAFCSLAVRPIEMEGVAPEVLDEGFLAKGKRFQELAMTNRHRFMHYSGPMFQMKVDKCTGLDILKDHADGRVMIDLSSFAKMNPAYPMHNAKPPVASYGAASAARRPHFPGDHGGRSNSVEFGSVSNGGTEVCDENLIFAPAIVYGFSFTLKKWGSFAVSGFSDISFDTNPFDALVMEPDSKQLVYNLVRQYLATPADPSQVIQRIDPIPHKGEGCIFLCYGPPGTGKTLTAESVAENMHRPLWSLSISELGSAPGELEQSLVKILDIAATWRAVLLIDEADVLLEKRSSSQSLLRNSMTGIFLRFLEYYRGVLFLTTNRVGTFDDALRSRISMFLHYPKLSIEHKEQVWTTLLQRAGVTGITADFISRMAAENLNGREIRNTIHTAQILAKSQGEILDQSHVLYATKVLLSSLKTLGDNFTLSEDEERSAGERRSPEVDSLRSRQLF